MSEIEHWAQDKPFLLALFAPQVATGAQDLHLLFKDMKNHKLLNQSFAQPDLSAWFSLYRSHRTINLFLKCLFSDFSPFSSESVDFGEMLSNADQIKKELGKPEIKKQLEALSVEGKVTCFQQAKAIQEKMLKESFEDLKMDNTGEPVPAEMKSEFLSMFTNSLEGQFYFFITVPCWLLYRDSATRIYRKARLGDYNSLEKLLRLDPLVIHDPSIGKQIQKFRFMGKSIAYENLIEAVLNKPKEKSTRKKMKYSVAGLISGLSLAINHPLTEPQIRQLFDAIAQDTRSQPIDTDLPESPESFAKAIQRDRFYWNKVLSPDNKM